MDTVTGETLLCPVIGTVGDTDVFTVLVSPCVELPARLDDPALSVVSRPCCLCIGIDIVVGSLGGGDAPFSCRTWSCDS